MSDQNTEALAAATKRRIELKQAISLLERTVSSPAAKDDWRSNVRRDLGALELALDQHCAEVEGERGLLAELTKAAPRLVNKIERVRDEHPELQAMTAAAIESADAGADVEALRASITDLLFALVRHRQRGADLVYEGYSVDIGGG